VAPAGPHWVCRVGEIDQGEPVVREQRNDVVACLDGRGDRTRKGHRGNGLGRLDLGKGIDSRIGAGSRARVGSGMIPTGIGNDAAQDRLVATATGKKRWEHDRDLSEVLASIRRRGKRPGPTTQYLRALVVQFQRRSPCQNRQRQIFNHALSGTAQPGKGLEPTLLRARYCIKFRRPVATECGMRDPDAARTSENVFQAPRDVLRFSRAYARTLILRSSSRACSSMCQGRSA